MSNGIYFGGTDLSVSLQGVHLSGTIGGSQQKIRVIQSFVNREPNPIEAIYTFPLPDGAAVCGFNINTGDKTFLGKVEEKEKALEDYDEAIRQGHGAYLLDQNRRDIFTINVGNINPLQAAEVIIDYIEEIRITDKHIRLEFPTTVSPRYTTSSGVNKNKMDMAVDQEMINPPKWLKVPYGISMDLKIEKGLNVKSVASSSHKIRFERNSENSISISLQDGTEAMNRNIVIDIEVEKAEPSAVCSRNENGENFITVNFLPEFDGVKESEINEVIFLVDCSGSMNGQSIKQAKQALELCLRTLNRGDAFNICCFGSSHNYLAKECLVYDRHTMQQAIEYVRSIDANLGGTEILTPLKEILKKRHKHAKYRQIVLLTDGQVSNEQALISKAGEYRKRNRVFSFGIGRGASQYLVKGLAEATRGESEFIGENERIESKVLRTFSRMNSPVVEKVSFDWYGADVDLADSEPGPVFEGDFLTLYGRTSGVLPEEVKMTVKFSDRSTEDFNLFVKPAEELLAAQWAFKRLKVLENNSLNDEGSKKDIQQMVEISKQYSVLCSETSYVAVEYRNADEINNGMPELRRIPVALTKGWGGIDFEEELKETANMSMSSSGFQPQYSIDYRSSSLDDLSIDSFDLSLSSRESTKKKRKPSLIERVFGEGKKKATNDFNTKRRRKISLPEKSLDDQLFTLLACQQADGLFSGQCSEKTKNALGKNWTAETGSTFEILLILNKKYKTLDIIWARAEKKALKSLARELNMAVESVQNLIAGLLKKDELNHLG